MAKKQKGGQNFSTKSVTMYGKTYKLTSLPEAQISNCAVYGLAVKLNRSTAGMDVKTYSDRERSEQYDKTFYSLRDNHWNIKGNSSGVTKKVLEDTVSAQADKLDAMGVQLAEAMAVIAKLMPPKQLSASAPVEVTGEVVEDYITDQIDFD